MQCQKHKELLERWWNDQLTETERTTLKAQLAECEDCQRELEGSRELWDLMGYMPVPEPSSGEMQANFNAMLEGYKEERTREGAADIRSGSPVRLDGGIPGNDGGGGSKSNRARRADPCGRNGIPWNCALRAPDRIPHSPAHADD